MNERAAPGTTLSRLVQIARDAGAGEVPEQEHAQGRERFVAALERAASPAAPRRSWLVPAAAVLAAAIVVLALVLRPEAPLGYAIDGAKGAESYVRAGGEGAAARFSEGTVIGFAPGARGRIAAVSAHGARVSLEDGSAHFQVAHLPRAEWTADAGPFTVQVTGTEFDLSWQRERFELRVQRGSVVVRGPLAPGGIALHAGQQLVADLTRGELTLRSEQAPVAKPEAAFPSATVSAPVEAGAPPPSTAAPPAPGAPVHAASADEGSPAPLSLRERLARNDFAGVIAAAEARGLEAFLEGSSLADLAALADAARYGGRGDLARRALLAERARFPGSAEARSAAFLLGRMAETGAPAAAISWYDIYLAEAPQGALAAEALGRKMVASKASAGREAARPIAEDYRRRFPRGAFAQAAAEILGDP